MNHASSYDRCHADPRAYRHRLAGRSGRLLRRRHRGEAADPGDHRSPHEPARATTTTRDTTNRAQYGLARTITLIKAARAEVAEQPAVRQRRSAAGHARSAMWSRRSQPLKDGEVHPAYKVMNQLGYDAANLGNHDFNYGLPFLKRALAGARLSVRQREHLPRRCREGHGPNAHHAFVPYLLLDREAGRCGRASSITIKVGVIGFVPPQIMQWDKANLEGQGRRARHRRDRAPPMCPRCVPKGAQLVIAIPHSGFERIWTGELAENEVGQLSMVPGIDAILFGHAHAEFPGPDFAEPAECRHRTWHDQRCACCHARPLGRSPRRDRHRRSMTPAGVVDGQRTSQASIRPIYDKRREALGGRGRSDAVETGDRRPSMRARLACTRAASVADQQRADRRAISRR